MLSFVVAVSLLTSTVSITKVLGGGSGVSGGGSEASGGGSEVSGGGSEVSGSGSEIKTSSLNHSIVGSGRPVTSAGMSMGCPFLIVIVSALKCFNMVKVGATRKKNTT